MEVGVDGDADARLPPSRLTAAENAKQWRHAEIPAGGEQWGMGDLRQALRTGRTGRIGLARPAACGW